MIPAGKLQHRIVIERETETVSPAGHVRKTWAHIATVRAEIRNMSSDEFLAGFGDADRQSAVFVIRWLPDMQITTADRIIHGGRVFNIKSVIEIGRKRGLELRAVAV